MSRTNLDHTELDTTLRAELLKRARDRAPFADVHSGAELAPTPEAYQREAMRTFSQEERLRSMHQNLALAGLGIAGEAGETVDLIKKHIFHGAPLDVEKLKLELGDQLWYITFTCELLGLTLEEVMGANIRKLRKRFPGEWSAEAQRAKADEVKPATKMCPLCKGMGTVGIDEAPCPVCHGAGKVTR